MRPLRLDITGTTDNSGNASIPLKLPSTGEWHELKVALSTTGPAEWAVLVSGTAITFGRGRRVTLGPELIQDGETVTVTVTGGPIASAIIGAITGKSGTPDEMLSSYGPQPNTIALDATAPRQKLYAVGVTPASAATPSFVVPATTTTTGSFILPAGTTALRIICVRVPSTPPSVSFILFVRGTTTSTQYYPGSLGSGTLNSPAGIVTVPVDLEWDPQVDITVNAATSANDIDVFVTALFAVEAPGQGGAAASVTLQNSLAPPWLVPDTSIGISLTFAAGVPQTVVPASGALRTYVHALFMVANAVTNVSLQDTNGTLLAQGSANAAGIALSTDLRGVPTLPGLGLRIVTSANAGINGTIAFRQAT